MQRGPVVPALLNRANAPRLKSVISFAGGEEERYFAPITTHRAALRVGSSRWFPGEFLKRWVWPVVKATVTSPQERKMQVRILPRNCARVAKLAKRLMFRGR